MPLVGCPRRLGTEVLAGISWVMAGGSTAGGLVVSVLEVLAIAGGITGALAPHVFALRAVVNGVGVFTSRRRRCLQIRFVNVRQSGGRKKSR